MATAQGKANGTIDLKLEVVVIPVSDVTRARDFYVGLGWRLDADLVYGAGIRVVQVTPPGSLCSVIFGTTATSAPPGSARGLYLVVSDIDAARTELITHGVDVSIVFHRDSNGAQVPGPNPGNRSYATYASFSDPDGNGWLLQEITERLPGRVDSRPAFASASDLANALRRAEAAHGQHEAKTGQRDANWPSWYAEYLTREQAGEALPS
jgi:catechol 2,3-dioxygenase-like lactoylglutathione lyase family enzyme